MTPRCLACKQPLPAGPAGHQLVQGRQQGGAAPQEQLPPGLCATCLAADSRWAETFASLLAEHTQQQEMLAAASSQCAHCHSGGLLSRIACSNSECAVLYSRVGAARRLATTQVRLERMDLCVPTTLSWWFTPQPQEVEW